MKKPNYILSVLTNRCPRCRRGSLFISKQPYDLKNCTKMYDHCKICNQPTEIEVGFYYGTGYVSYALTVAITVATFIAWWVLIGIGLNDNRIFWWLGMNAALLILLQPLLMRLSRSLWISWFVKYDSTFIDNE
jgi:uncharacterized protein (DUF983 family)